MAGLLTSFPIVTGPALFFFAMEQGDAFTAEASRGAPAAVVAVAGSGLAYAWASLRTPWWISLAGELGELPGDDLALLGRGLAARWGLTLVCDSSGGTSAGISC